MKKQIFLTIRLIWLLCIAGCIANIPLMHYYTFQPGIVTTTETGSPKYPYILGIETFEADVPYQQDRIVFRTSPYEVSFYEYHRWLRPPTELVTEQVQHDLKMAGLFDWVHTFGFESYADYTLRGKIIMFDQWYKENQTSWVQVGIQYQLIDSEDGRILWMDSVETTATVSDMEILEIVKGFESALQKNIQHILLAINNAFAQKQ